MRVVFGVLALLAVYVSAEQSFTVSLLTLKVRAEDELKEKHENRGAYDEKVKKDLKKVVPEITKNWSTTLKSDIILVKGERETMEEFKQVMEQNGKVLADEREMLKGDPGNETDKVSPSTLNITEALFFDENLFEIEYKQVIDFRDQARAGTRPPTGVAVYQVKGKGRLEGINFLVGDGKGSDDHTFDTTNPKLNTDFTWGKFDYSRLFARVNENMKIVHDLQTIAEENQCSTVLLAGTYYVDTKNNPLKDNAANPLNIFTEDQFDTKILGQMRGVERKGKDVTYNIIQDYKPVKKYLDKNGIFTNEYIKFELGLPQGYTKETVQTELFSTQKLNELRFADMFMIGYAKQVSSGSQLKISDVTGYVKKEDSGKRVIKDSVLVHVPITATVNVKPGASSSS